jgi:hypothetical protein
MKCLPASREGAGIMKKKKMDYSQFRDYGQYLEYCAEESARGIEDEQQGQE